MEISPSAERAMYELYLASLTTGLRRIFLCCRAGILGRGGRRMLTCPHWSATRFLPLLRNEEYLRVCPESSGRIAEFSEHEAD